VPEVALEHLLATHTDAARNATTDALREELRRVRMAFVADVAALCTVTRDRARCLLVDGDGRSHDIAAGTAMVVASEITDAWQHGDAALTTSGDTTWIAALGDAAPRVAVVVRGARSPHDPITQASAIAAVDRCARHLSALPVFDLTVDRASRVQRVLDDELFLVVFQPMVDLRRGTTAALEAFSRFPAEPVRGPHAWFAEAADIGLGVALEIAAVRHALQYIDDVPRDARLAVNVSASTAHSRAFLDAIIALPLDRLILEVDGFSADEAAIIADKLEVARDCGLLVAVHELRNGMIDVGRLVTLRPDIVKLDGSIVDRVDSDAAARATVRSAMTLLRGNDVDACRVVATNVERRGQLDTLTLLGVDWGQGYYLGRPAHVRVPRTRG